MTATHILLEREKKECVLPDRLSSSKFGGFKRFFVCMRKTFTKFNQEGSLLVITSYPYEEGEGAKQNAVACYCQNLLSSYKGRNIVVLADKDGHPKDIEKKGNILVVRAWKPGSLDLFFQVIKNLVRFGRIRDILIQFEFNMLGSVILTSLLPLFVAFLKILGKRVIITQHQVVGDLSSLSGHLNIRKNSFKDTILTFGLHVFYSLLGLFSDSIIVHEEILKSRLTKWVNPNKIYVVSHGLNLEEKIIPKSKAKSLLGIDRKDFVVLLFGYIAWYKGTDWLIKKIAKVSKKHPNFKLLVVGGASATLEAKAHYRRYLNRVYGLARRNQTAVRLTGYIPDSEVGKYFCASDIVVLPYRTMMSASGPLSFALRFKKPVLLSRALSPVFRNKDINLAVQESDIGASQLIFTLSGNDFEKKLINFSTDGKLYTKSVRFSENLRNQRSWNSIVCEYDNILNRPEVTFAPSLDLSEESVR